MASVWDQYAKPKQKSVWDQYKTQPEADTGSDYYDFPETPTAPTPKNRGILGATNDYVIEAANAILGGGKALIDFAVPGTELANQIEALIQQGVQSQSQVAQQAKQNLARGIEAGGMEALGAVGEYVTSSPGLALSQAVGSFVVPGVAIKAGRGAAAGLGVGERAVTAARQAGPITPEMAAIAGERAIGRVGLGVGATAGAALGGGDAAGQAYETVLRETGDEALATQAAREASVAPAVVGGLTGLVGAERLFAGLGRAGKGGRVRAATTAGLSEAAQEAVEEGVTQLSANIAAGQYVPGIDPMSGVVGSSALGAVLGGITGAGLGAITGGGQPQDLLDAGLKQRQLSTLARFAKEEQLRERPLEGLLQPGEGLSTRDLINRTTGITRQADQPRSTRESMEAALNEPTGQMVAGPGGIERELTAGELYGLPRAPAAAAQQAAQQTQGARQAQAQAAQVDQAVAQQIAQAYGIQQVPPGPNVPTQAFTIAGKTVIGVPRVNQIVSEIAQANQNKSPERVQLEAAIVSSGIPLGGQASAKGILGGIDSAIKKFQLDGAATLNDAANILDFQIGQAKTAKAAEPMARVYEALTGEMSPAFLQLSEGPTPTPAATGTLATPPASLGLMQQPTGAPSGQPTQRAAAPAPAPAATTTPAGREPAAAPVQVQPVRAAERSSAAPSARTEEAVTAGAQTWDDMNVSTVQYSDLSEQDQADWEQAVAEGRATGEMQEQLAAEYELVQEQAFMQQVLDRIINRVIKSPQKARYFSTFLVVGARQQEIMEKATANAERDADGNLTEQAKKQLKALNQELSALRGEPNEELASEYKVALDTLKEWNQQLRTFLTDKAQQIQEAARVVAVELRLEGGDLRSILSQMVARHQQTQADLQAAVQPDEIVFDERDLAVEETGVTAKDRTAASVQEVYNASETINARYLRLQQELIDAENDGNEALAQEITEKLDLLTEDAAKLAAKQTSKRATPAKKETKRAVQKQSAAKVSVQPAARGGQEVGQEVRGTEKPAAESQATTEEKPKGKVIRVVKAAPKAEAAAPVVSKTKAEEVEAKYNELRGFAPDILPEWSMLTEEQRNKLFAIDNPADINFKNLEQLVDETNVIDVEFVEITPAQRTLLLTETSKLNGEQVKLLESEYGAKSGTEAFLNKLNQDITNYVNKGAEFVAARIRGIIQQLAKAALAVAVIFNPTIVGTNFGFDLQNAYASIKAQKLEAVIPVDVISEMSPEAQTAYQQLAPVAKQSNRGFIIADKPNGKIHMFYSSGQHLVTDTALYGKGVGDILQGDTNRGFDWSKKVTPAGKFTLKAVPDAGYEGGYRLDLVETNDGVGVIAIHPAYLGDAKEKRLERLASADVKDNRISYGCINTSHGTFLNKIKPQLGEFNGGMVVVLPDGPFSPKPSARPVQFSRRRRDEMTKSNVADIEQSIYNFVGAVNQERLRIVQSIKDVPLYVREAIKRDEGIELSRTEQAFVYGGRAYLIADNIVPGTERAVFMHEVGSHLGLEKILNAKQIIALAEQIQKWTNKDDGSVESRIANAAYDRLIAAKLEQANVYGKLSPTSRKELIAYFIEEATLAGINPTAIDAKTALGRWFRTVWAAFKAAIRKLRLDPERLNAVDVVNMAYGAAKLEITGTWHGSAAIFQNFRTQYIGTGEGAQAFGWGMYFARSYGIAKDYFLRDKQRKALLAFASVDKAAPLLDELIEKADKALDEADTFPALNRELNRDVINPETQEVLFPKGTVLTKNALIEMHRLGINIIEIKGSSLPKTDPDFDPRVSAAEIPVVPYHKLPEDSLWLQPSMGLTSLSTTLQITEFFELWFTLDMPGLVDKLAESDKSKPRAYWAQFVLNDFRKNHPEFTDATNSFYVTANPAGSIMRADIGFGVDQTLIWDKPFSQQSLLVQEKLLQAKGLANFPKDMLDSASGKAIYQFFATGALGRDYIAGQDKEASEKLYKLGIKGISYFDRSSRTIDFLSYSDRTDLNAVARKLGTTGESLANEIEWLGAEQVINKYSLLDGGNMRSEVLAYEKYIDQNRTRNIIAFNEADVVRAFSQIGMEGSTAIDRVQFSRRADAAISRLPTVAQPQATQIYYTLKDWASKVAPTFAFTQDLVDLAKKLMPSSKDFIRLYNEKQVTQTDYELQVKAITDAYDALPDEVKGVGAGSVNRFIKDSTMSGKWGYKLKPDSDVTPDPQLEARFNAFPKEAQDVIKSVFSHGYKVLNDMKNAIRNNVNTEYDALIEAAKDRGDAKEVAELQAAKDGLLRDYQRLFALRGNKPYAPLKRFGNYVVIGKSQRFLDLEAELEKAKPDTRSALRTQLTELERQAQHYYVGFAETAGEGQVLANSIRNDYAMVTDPFEKSVEESLYGGTDLNQVFARLRNLSEENLKDTDNTAVARGIRKMIVDMQTMMLSQQSVMHATNRRLGVAGADDDMMRAFSTQGRASAHFIGSLTNTGKIYEQLRKMRKEAGYNPEARRYFNEFVLRHNMGYDYDPSPILNKAMATTSLWMLLTSPAYYLQNLTQPIMMSVPFMAGKRNRSYTATQKALFDAYKEVGKLLQDISIKRPGQQVDFDKLPPDVRDMVKELVKRGRIQITLDRDLGEYTSGEDSAFRKLGKVSEYLRSMAEKVELTNRIATAIAAYRLELSDGVNSSEATNYADKVIRVTHGSYAGADAPRVMRKGVGRLITQFRKFQLIQISMMIRLLNDATKSAPSDERYAARKALVWTLTHAGIAGGIMGLPGFAAIAAVYGLAFGDEDEPYNPELELRKYFGDGLGDLMAKGLPAQFGVDVSGKIGMGQMLSILPYTDFNLSRAGWQETVTAAMGPFIGGLAPRVIEGVRYINEGSYYKGLENILPKGVGDTLKGIRLTTEGVTQRNNDVVLDNEELNFVDGIFQVFGLPTTTITKQQFRTRTTIETEEFYSKLTTDLKRAYAAAYRDNDNQLLAELRARWDRIQDRRVELKLKRQPKSELLKAPQEQRKRERETAGGVQFTNANRRFVESLPI